MAEKQIPGPVLLITITNVKYPVNAEVLFSIFNRYGEVLRAIIFDKVQGLQAMVEMASADQAQKAIEGMNGQCIYSESNLMDLQFSNKQSLTISQQSEKARDFTLPTAHEDEPPIRKIKATAGSM